MSHDPVAQMLPTVLTERLASVDQFAGLPGLVRTVEDDRQGRKVQVARGTVDGMLADACRVYKARGDADGRDSWAGASMEDAVSLAFTGWHEALPIVDDLFARIVAKRTASIIPTLDYSDEPDGDVDVERWQAGEDECFLVQTAGRHTVSVAGSFVDLVLDPFASCDVEAATVLRRGVYFVALAYMLERAGYRVRLAMRMATEGDHKLWLLDVAVKDYEQPLDLPRTLFWIAHPASLRRVVIMSYRDMRQDPIFTREDTDRDPSMVVAPGIHTSTDLDEWVNGLLDKFGLTLEGE